MFRPYILSYTENIENKYNTEHLPYTYDHYLSLNIINNSKQKLPYIHNGGDNIETLTKTEEDRESDEDELSFLELLTKTFDDNEKDEENNNIELLTKTKDERESDEDDYILINK